MDIKLAAMTDGKFPDFIYNLLDGEYVGSLVTSMAQYGRFFHLDIKDIKKNKFIGR